MKKLITNWCRCFVLVGLVLVGIGFHSDNFAENKIISGHIGGGTVGGWAGWDETSEAGLASSTINVCFMENTSGGGNETSQGGGLSGADLVWTQAGTLAGMSGGVRAFDGSDDRLEVTTGFIQGVFNSASAWTIIICFDPLTTTDNGDVFLNWNWGNESSQQTRLQMFTGAGPNLNFVAGKDSGVTLNSGTADSYSSSGKLYVVMCSDGTDTIGGFSTTRPTKLSDFAAGKHVHAGAGVSFDATDWTTATVSQFMQATAGSVKYIINAKECLIDLGS